MIKNYDINNLLLSFKSKRIYEENIRSHKWMQGQVHGTYKYFCEICEIDVIHTIYNGTGKNVNLGSFTCNEILIKKLLE